MAEGAQALEADVEANIGNGSFRFRQQLAGPFEPTVDEVLVGRFMENLPKCSEQMVLGEACHCRELRERDRRGEHRRRIIPRPAHTSV